MWEQKCWQVSSTVSSSSSLLFLFFQKAWRWVQDFYFTSYQWAKLFCSHLMISFLPLILQRALEPPDVHHERLLPVSIAGLLVNLVGIFVFQHGGHGHSHSGEGAGCFRLFKLNVALQVWHLKDKSLLKLHFWLIWRCRHFLFLGLYECIHFNIVISTVQHFFSSYSM